MEPALTGLLFTASETLEQVTPNWYLSRDGCPMGLALYERHYSAYQYADGRVRKLFVGPGEKLVLVGADADALFVWRKFISGDGQEGVNCAVFRNESARRSSDLIREAVALAAARWPGERLYTYVNGGKVRLERGYRKPGLPGHCFLKAGWDYVRDAQGAPVLTKENRLYILEWNAR